MTDSLIPERIHRADRGIVVSWGADHVSTYPARALRLACQCATCKDEFSGRALLDPGAVPADIRAEALWLVGNYAVKIRWSDGHDTGIYTYEHLLSLCACARCRADIGG